MIRLESTMKDKDWTSGGNVTADAVDDRDAIEQLRSAYARIRAELAKVIVGQHEVLEQLLIALFAGGHCILEGVPGLAKTLTISTLARCLTLSFKRIQFTPDLMPSDITGTEVIQEDRATGAREFKFLQGPIFNNVILADEINPAPLCASSAPPGSMRASCRRSSATTSPGARGRGPASTSSWAARCGPSSTG